MYWEPRGGENGCLWVQLNTRKTCCICGNMAMSLSIRRDWVWEQGAYIPTFLLQWSFLQVCDDTTCNSMRTSSTSWVFSIPLILSHHFPKTIWSRLESTISQKDCSKQKLDFFKVKIKQKKCSKVNIEMGNLYKR